MEKYSSLQMKLNDFHMEKRSTTGHFNNNSLSGADNRAHRRHIYI